MKGREWIIALDGRNGAGLRRHVQTLFGCPTHSLVRVISTYSPFLQEEGEKPQGTQGGEPRNKTSRQKGMVDEIWITYGGGGRKEEKAEGYYRGPCGMRETSTNPYSRKEGKGVGLGALGGR